MYKSIALSEPFVWLMKYLYPFLVAVVTTLFYLDSKDYQFTLIIFAIGLLDWFFRILPLKEVNIEDYHLIISNDFKKDIIHIDDIDNLTTGGWYLYITRIHFKRKTKFGQTIKFATMQWMIGFGISDKAKSILSEIQTNIGKQENKQPITPD